MVDGPEFYDDDAVFATYMARRRQADNPNDTMEGPVVRELLGDLRGLRVLDLGCGAGEFGRKVLDRGASVYVGVEASRNMARIAREAVQGTVGQIVEDRLERWNYPKAGFDVVTSRLALHYVNGLDDVFAKVASTLVEHGRFVFSVEHPVITSCARGWPDGTARQDWIVDDYFDSGPRVTSWMGGEVRKCHRTVEDHFRALRRAGFFVDDLREATPQRERFADAATYERRVRIPLFLIMAARKG